jgi:hypothetical protein
VSTDKEMYVSLSVRGVIREFCKELSPCLCGHAVFHGDEWWNVYDSSDKHYVLLHCRLRLIRDLRTPNVLLVSSIADERPAAQFPLTLRSEPVTPQGQGR